MTAPLLHAFASVLHVRSAALGDTAPAVANHLWQSTAFAAAAALLTLALRRNTARVRHGIWMAASIKFLLPFALLSGLAAHFVRPKTVTVPRSVVVYSAVEDFSEPFVELAPVTAPAVVAPKISLGDWLPLAAFVAWLTGGLTLLGVWTVRWRRIARTVRGAELMAEGREVSMLRALEAAGNSRKPLRIALCEDSMEPGVFGIANPVLSWPTGISERLSDAQLEAVLEHELCHVRRRDNLTAALHMLVEAVFWFHPMVWWVGARLTAERERACDERVLEVCGRPAAYAESILKVCAFSIESPLECVSGITGADLKQRVVEIMSARIALRLTFAKKVLLAAVAVCVLAVPFVLGQAQAARRIAAMMIAAPQKLLPAFLKAPAAQAASAADAAAPAAQEVTPSVDSADSAPGPKFEVASIHPYAPGPVSMRWQQTPDGLIEQGMALKLLIANAYGIPQEYIFGGPDWISSQPFDIDAKLGEKETANFAKLSPKQRDERFKAMLQTLLTERFKMTLRRETRQLPVYALIVAKGGPRLTESPPLAPDADGVMPPEGASITGFADGRQRYRRMTMREFAAELSRNPEIARQVDDETGLTGRYDFDYKWQASADSTGPSLFTALDEQLGLKLEPRKGPIQTLTIVSAEKPSVDGAEVVDPGGAHLMTVALERQKTDAQVPGVAGSPDVPKANPAAFDAVPAKISFAVISFKPCPPDRYGNRMMDMPPDADFIAYHCEPTTRLINFAYGGSVNPYNLASGYPAWVDQDRYEFVAKVAPEDIATWQKMTLTDHRLVMRTVLAEELKFKIHLETTQLPVYALTLAKSEPKLTPGKAGEPDKLPDGEVLTARGEVWIGVEAYFHAYSMGDLASNLTQHLDRTVINQTELTGFYDFTLPITPGTGWNPYQGFGDPMQGEGVPLVDGLKALGLRIEAAKAPVQKLVIDHIEKPMEN